MTFTIHQTVSVLNNYKQLFHDGNTWQHQSNIHSNIGFISRLAYQVCNKVANLIS